MATRKAMFLVYHHFRQILVAIAVVLCLIPAAVVGQSVGIGTNNPNSNAALDITAPRGDQGILLPRLSGAQRNSMSLGMTERGLIVYDTTDDVFYYWDGTQWLAGLGNSSGSVDYQTLAFDQATAVLSIQNGNSVNLSSLIDDADTDPKNEAISDFRITATAIEIEENGVLVGSVPLSGLPSGSDDQLLSLAGTILNLEDGGNVDLSGILFSGEFGDLSNVPVNLDIDATDDLTVGSNISNLNNDVGFITNPDDADADPTNELITDFRITGTSLEIEENGIVHSVPLLGLPSITFQSITTFQLGGAFNQELEILLENDVLGGKSVDLHDIGFTDLSDLTGNLGVAILKPASVTSAKIQDGAITNVKINDVDPSKLNQASANIGDVLKWNGTEWAPANDAVTAIPVTSYYAIDPSDFMAIHKQNQAVSENNVLIFRNSNEFVTVRLDSEGDELIAPVHLPHRAIVQSITFYYFDSQGPDIEFILEQRSYGSGTVTLGVVTSVENSNGVFSKVLNGPFTIDNSLHSYAIIARMSTPGEVQKPNDADHGIYGIVVEYTNP